ncbi:DUF5057 domain-containing protein [uncultured Clostridium sp.]|uniref:DUF5057 domain-containing protein n=1 Tax=uncultured Clostridium sp. TaxID=59620 RepID=UPI0028E89D52|nr:DUF5057 domain-containing protein [uncultured Clostridium sp.]
MRRFKFKDNIKNKADNRKKKIRILSALLTILFIISTIAPISANAVNNYSTIPEIKITYEGLEPSNPKVGEDFKVKYKINPQPFYYEDSKQREIVLALDTSGSMGQEIKQLCKNYDQFYCEDCGKWVDKTNEEHRNEKPYINHSIGWDKKYYCRDCNKWLETTGEEHKNEKPYIDHLFGSEKYCTEHNMYEDHYVSTTKIDELKKAAENFIDSLTDTKIDGQTPDVKNLKIGIVSYNNSGYIDEGLVQVTDSDRKNNDNINELKDTIENLRADGGTNTGDGLRKAAYLLNEENEANKTVIFMGDGEPTYYSSSDRRGNDYYKILDTKNPGTTGIFDYGAYLQGTGYSDSNGYCLEYATIIGNLIKDKNYNIFSVGYGLGDENSASNKKMKQIHESIGGISSGESSTFFASDEGAIDKVFQQIADTIIKTSFDDVKLNLNLGDNITAVSGIELKEENNGTIKINPIIYTKSKNNQYTAPSQTIEFTVRANKDGEIPLLKDGSNISYTDINGIPVTHTNIENPKITILLNEATDKEIRILEIEPADSFKLNPNYNENKTGISKTQKQGYDVIVEHMTMPEFIGKTNELNGKYDAIVIGNYVDNKCIENEYQFRDYKGLENDITDLKAKEITEFIDSGQLVYLDSYLYNTNAVKLNRHYNERNGYWNQTTDNLIKYMSVNDYYDNEITLEKVINKYIDRITENPNLKRPNLNVPGKPISDNKNDELGNADRRKMKFDIKLNEILDEDSTINLYLDINGDGLFKKEEAVKTIKNAKFVDGSYSFEYNFHNDYPEFIGYLDWRIEVVKQNVYGYSNSIVSYYDGNVLFRRVKKEKRLINVLQVSPYGRNELGDNQSKNLNLKQNTDFQNLLKELKDYDIKVDVISYQDFYQGDFKGPGEDSLKESKYDIVIAGFSDCYSDKINQYALDQIKDYIKVGQGLMLTHDTLWYTLEQMQYSDKKIMKQFRDYVGQSRYKDQWVNKDEIDIDGKNKIPHDIDKPNGDSKEAIGSTLWARRKAEDVNNSNSTEVYRVNKSLITNYPFELGENIRVRRTHGQYLQLNLEDENVIPWFTLTDNNKNNNDENTPYGGTNSGHIANKYDPRNNFYTYSKGNITFSGTGENTRENCPYPISELKLFVNTIVKAERGANHKPTITALENVNEIPSNKELEFKAVVKDVDGDKIKINSIKVKLEKDNDDKYEDVSNYNSLPSKLKSQGSSFDLKIPSSYFENRINKDIIILIEAEDEKGAKRIKEYTVVPTLEALLVAKEQKVQALTEDNIELNIPLERKNDDYTPSKIEDVKLGEIEYSDQNISLNNMKIEYSDEKYYLVGKLKPLRQLTGEPINIKINYNSSKNPKVCNINVVADSKDGEINLILQDSRGDPLKNDVKATLSNKEGFNSKVTIEKLVSEYMWPKDSNDKKIVSSDEYSVSLDDYEMDKCKYEISRDGKIILDQTPSSFKMNYTNPKIQIIIKLGINNTEITHGIYNGIKNGKPIINNSNNIKFPKGAHVTMGAYIENYLQRDSINLEIADGLEVIGDVSIFTINNDGTISKDAIKMDSIDQKNFTKALNEISSNNVLVRYTVKVPENINGNEAIYINNIKVEQGNEVPGNIHVKNMEMPELF